MRLCAEADGRVVGPLGNQECLEEDPAESTLWKKRLGCHRKRADFGVRSWF